MNALRKKEMKFKLEWLKDEISHFGATGLSPANAEWCCEQIDDLLLILSKSSCK